MGILSGLFSGMAQAVATASKGVDEAAEKLGVSGIFRIATSSFAEATGRFANHLEDTGHSTGTASAHSDAGIFHSLKNMLSRSAEETTISGEKLGGNAIKQKALETAATVSPNAGSFHADFNSIEVPVTMSLVSASRGASAGMSTG